MNRLYLVRHGENLANITKEFSYRQVDYSLTPKGMLQARQTAEYFRTQDIHAVYSSPLKRAYETAEPIAEAVGLPVVVMENLRELNVGSLEGRPPTMENWDSFVQVYRAWMSGHPEVAFPEGENYLALWSRLREALERIVIGQTDRNIIVVGHGGIFAVMVRELCPGGGVDDERRTESSNCSITELAVDYQDGRLHGELINWASCAHLGGEAAELVSGVPEYVRRIRSGEK